MSTAGTPWDAKTEVEIRVDSPHAVAPRRRSDERAGAGAGGRGGNTADRFRRFAARASEKLGSHWAFLAAVVVVVVWVVTGPIFHFSDAWQLVINTGTTVVTFLMVFLIQSTQNRDARAIHLKLDELIRSSKARNVFADLEDATEDEISAFEAEFRKLRRGGADTADAADAAHRAVHQPHRDR